MTTIGLPRADPKPVRSQLSQLLSAVTTLYLLVPAFIFAFGWLRPRFLAIELLVLAVLVIALLREIYLVSRDLIGSAAATGSLRFTWKPVVALAAGLSILGIWTLLSGSGGFGFQNPDYVASNGLLRDLIVKDWPLKFGTIYSQKYLVYYAGYYLPAAAIGKVLGWNAANYFLLLWTLLGVGLAFAWFANLSRVRFGRHPFKLAALAGYFCLAGGLDVIGWYVVQSHPLDLTRHVQWWATYFQYSSNTTLLYWVPQQALAAWLVTGVVADALLDGGNVRFVGPAWAASVLWSPFGDLGITPILLVVLLSLLRSGKGRAVLFSRASILLNGLSVWIAAVYLIYLSANAFRVEAGPIWTFVKDHRLLISTLLEFWLLEFALLAGLVALYVGPNLSSGTSRLGQEGRPNEREESLGPISDLSGGQRILLLVSVSALFVLPLYRVGFYDDIVMRASIPALFMFWALVGKVVFDIKPWAKMRFSIIRLLIMAAVLAGFFPAVVEISRSIVRYHFGPPSIAEVSSQADQSTRDEQQRAGFSSAFFFRFMGK